ncbi:MAG: hypothetical protein R2746_06815 [Acidimicrobiales bacterium]
MPREPGIGSIFGGATGEMYAVVSYRVLEPGTYRLSASGGNAAEVGIAPSLSDREVGRLIGSGILTLLAALGLGLGLLFGLIGVIWLLIGGSGPPPPAYAPQPGWGAYPPPGPPPPEGIWPWPGRPLPRPTPEGPAHRSGSLAPPPTSTCPWAVR